MNKNVAQTALLDGRKRTEVRGSGLYARNLEREQEVMMHGLVELLAYLDDHYHFVLSYVRAPGRGDFSCGLRFVLPAQCRAGIQ